MRDADIHAVVSQVKKTIRRWKEPVLGVVARETRDPFRILIACLLSLRTKDQTTDDASQRLFRLADTPEHMSALSIRTIEKAIYPVGFYKNKAKQIRGICQSLLRDFGGRVPDTIEELLTLKGVGRKTANLVVTVGYRNPGFAWISTCTGSVTGGATFKPGLLRKPNALFEINFPQNIGSRVGVGTSR